MTIKAIIFDFDDTLAVERASAEEAMMITCKKVREKYDIEPQELYDNIWENARELWHNSSPVRSYCVAVAISSWEGLWGLFEGDDENLKILRSWTPTYRKQAWYSTLLESGIDDIEFAEYLSLEFPKHRRKIHNVFEDAEPNLIELKNKYKLALVTNGASDLQREKIDGSKLAKYFDVIVIAGDVGIRKPEPEIFNIVLSRIETKPNEAIMIGNALDSDIIGAQKAGIKTVWLNRKNEINESDIKPDYEIKSINQLRLILDDLE
ncbi:MAG: HAD family hydrolase [Sedimentisphaerales bacterium]|nr:HAD family hydrolase [Sedimentisphaerales bacterium]